MCLGERYMEKRRMLVLFYEVVGPGRKKRRGILKEGLAWIACRANT